MRKRKEKSIYAIAARMPMPWRKNRKEGRESIDDLQGARLGKMYFLER
jgi:hypothetical protein